MSGLPDTDSVLRKVPNCSTHAGGSVGGISKKAEPDFEFSEPITQSTKNRREHGSRFKIFGISKGKFQRLQKISLYLLGHFQEKYQRAKNNSVQPGQNFQNPFPTKLVGSLNPHFCPNWTEVKKPT